MTWNKNESCVLFLIPYIRSLCCVDIIELAYIKKKQFVNDYKFLETIITIYILDFYHIHLTEHFFTQTDFMEPILSISWSSKKYIPVWMFAYILHIFIFHKLWPQKMIKVERPWIFKTSLRRSLESGVSSKCSTICLAQTWQRICQISSRF